MSDKASLPEAGPFEGFKNFTGGGIVEKCFYPCTRTHSDEIILTPEKVKEIKLALQELYERHLTA